MVTIDKIKKLREETEVSLQECKKALEEAGGNLERAKEILKARGREIAQKKAQRKAGQGIVSSYIHPNNRVGVLLDLRCESDFVARSDDFKRLAHELCLQIAAMAPQDLPSLMAQPWIKDESKVVADLVQEAIAKLGENIVVKTFCRYEI